MMVILTEAWPEPSTRLGNSQRPVQVCMMIARDAMIVYVDGAESKSV